jgi:amino acid transporter
MQFAFTICLLYTIGDVEKATNTRTGLPIIEVVYEATKSKAATNMFILALIVVLFISLFNVFASVSRLTWAFSRDKGMPFHNFFAIVSSYSTPSIAERN